MIRRIQTGAYRLIETKHNTKVLYIDSQSYAWVETSHIGEILVYSHNAHREDCSLAAGTYNLYEVVNEPQLSDNLHLELKYGRNLWQGYLLLTGLPNKQHKRARIIPTTELITKNVEFKNKVRLRPKSQPKQYSI